MGSFGLTFSVSKILNLALVMLSAWMWPCLCRNSTFSCREEERDALLEFKNSLDVYPPDLLRSWGGKEDCCRWKGVGCDAKTGHVIELELLPDSDNFKPYMASELSPSLSRLRFMTHLDLSGFQFSFGSSANFIPEFLGSMKQLRFLNLSQVQAAYLPLNCLSNLDILDLWHGETVVNDVQWILSLRHLKYLDMSGNNLQAKNLMQVLSMLPSLSYLSLSYCGLNNSDIPLAKAFNNSFFASLSHLDLSSNSFKGPVPSLFHNISSLASLSHLDLSCNSFKGPVPSLFHNISSLIYLDLSRNQFQGQIPEELQNMTSLTYLNMRQNHFTSVPHSFINLKSLVHLDISGNSLNSLGGGFEVLVGEKCNLRYLNLDSNGLEGEMTLVNSTEFCASNLEYFSASHNRFQGKLPEWLVNLKRLNYLALNHNSFTGNIPTDFGQLLALRSLNMQNNRLSGAVSEDHLLNLSKLEYLDLSENELVIAVASDWVPPFRLSYLGMATCKFETPLPLWLRTQVSSALIWNLSNADIVGTLPNWFSDHGWDIEVDLSHNNISGPVPKLSLFSSGILDLSHNQFTGAGPDFTELAVAGYLGLSYNWISGSLPCFAVTGYLDLSHNQISGPISNISAVTGYLDLSYNQISGPISNSSAFTGSLDLSYNQITGPLPILSSGSTLDLSHNMISGPIPTSFVSHNARNLYLNDNIITGPIPTSLCDAINLTELDLSRNKLIGSIPDCWSNGSYDDLYLIKFSFNKLSGPIPSSLGNISCLMSLHLNDNRLHGQLPMEWPSPEFFKVLDIGGNGIDGNIPAWIGRDAHTLQILRLRGNRITGRIPRELCLLSELQVLDLAENSLDGTVLDCLGNLSGMSQVASRGTFGPYFWYREQVDQRMKGIDLEYTTNIKFVVALDLSSNNLVGTIPDNLMRLRGLLGLNLSHNSLSGNIPQKIGDMDYLESLDLSSNRLSGNIPASISTLSFLSYLNLSHNNMAGRVPKGKQLDTLYNPENSIYAGNPLLCGDPLPNKCPRDEVVPPSKNPRAIDYLDRLDLKDKAFLYGVVAAGFATGFWGVIGILVIKKNWRAAFFQIAEDIGDRAYVFIIMKLAKLKRRMGST